ncbi:NUDIX hydrolase [Cellulomonas sp.]|uniref:NUDIX hydrolase n=1 Tax=Cellulomonas sp. TaxID=40001 RepID=UPI003BACF1D7
MSSPARPPVPGGVPAPPGGHALRIDPRHSLVRVPNAPLPVVDETSAGGIVVSRREGVHHAAVIARRNRAGRLEWCLPKGHLEGDETPEEAAVREIAEETGITGQVLRRLGVIDYWFSGDDRRVHKVVHHFLLGATGGSLSVEGDPDGEAEEAAWIPVAELHGVLAYPNERRLAEAALVVLVGEA